jgi:hypothetical protein
VSKRNRDDTAPPTEPAKASLRKTASRERFDFNPIEWVALNDAFARIRKAVGSRDFAERDLQRGLCLGGLRSAARWLDRRADLETCERLKPPFWKELRIVALSGELEGQIRVRVRIQIPAQGRVREHPLITAIRRGRSGYFYVLRADLDRFYPLHPATSAAAPIGVPAVAAPPLPRRRRGPVVTHEWFAICGEIAARCVNASGGIIIPKNASALARKVNAWCEIEFGQQAPDSEMREAVRQVCARLRQVIDRPRKKPAE